MKWLFVVSTSLFLTTLCQVAWPKSPRTLRLAETDIGEIHTALGYSTILQFDSLPTSSVLGDQDGFKVEYVGNALTIKPVVSGARTNLFVFTDYERFNFRINTGPPVLVDYAIQVKRKRRESGITSFDRDLPVAGSQNSAPSETMTTFAIGTHDSCGFISLEVESIAFPTSKPWLVIYFVIKTPDKVREMELKPEFFSLLRNKVIVPIETLYLERGALGKTADSVRGNLWVRHPPPSKSNPLVLEFSPSQLKGKACSPLKVPIQLKNGGKHEGR